MRHDAVELSVTWSGQNHRRGGVSPDDSPRRSFKIRVLFNYKPGHTVGRCLFTCCRTNLWLTPFRVGRARHFTAERTGDAGCLTIKILGKYEAKLMVTELEL